MASGIVDELCPMYVGAEVIALSLADALATPTARSYVEIAVDYSDAEPSGVNLPLELLIVGPSEQCFERRMFRRALPGQFSFLPPEAGKYQLLLREVGHNRWLGKLYVDVQGD